MHAHVCISSHVHVHVCRSQRMILGVFYCCLPYFLESRPPTKPRHSYCFPERLVARKSHLSCFYLLSVPGLQVCVGDGLFFYIGLGDLNSGTYACTVKYSYQQDHHLIPWQNFFILSLWVVGIHQQMYGISSTVMNCDIKSVPQMLTYWTFYSSVTITGEEFWEVIRLCGLWTPWWMNPLTDS